MLNDWDEEFFRKELKIFRTELSLWEGDDLNRLLALLKVDPLEQLFRKHEIHNLLKPQYLEDKIEPNMQMSLYFPYHKYKAIINLLNQIYRQAHESSSQSLESTNNPSPYNQATPSICVYFGQPLLFKLKQAIDALQQLLIIQMSTIKLMTIFKKIGLQQDYISLVKKYNCDGFTFVCLLASSEILSQLGGLMMHGEMIKLQKLSVLLLCQYYRQMLKVEMSMRQEEKFEKKQQLEKTMPKLEKQSSAELQKTLYSLPLSSSEMDSMGKSADVIMISSMEMSKKMSDDDIEADGLGQSEIAESEPMQELAQSEYGMSEYGVSEYGVSERGSLAMSQYRDSEYLRNSMTEETYRPSLMYDPQIQQTLQESSMNLPFKLLNLQALQQIKIRRLISPFSKEVEKDHHELYSIQGVKFGRDKENDQRFPDQLSISNKHARIYFKDDNFYLQDLGSKTGTFLRIRGMLNLKDEVCIQFSHQAQIVFKVLKKQKNEGMIKAEIKKPDNYHDYKVSLRQNFKIKIGRSESCHIKIDVASIGQKHGQIFYKNGTFTYKDCNVSSGSWNRLSQRSVVSEGFKLNKGDIFRLSSKKSFYVDEIQNQLLKP